MNLVKRPEILFLIASIGFVFQAFTGSDQTIDIHVHDTYYVIGKPFLYLAPAVLFFFFWLIYTISRRILLADWLTWMHVLLTFVFVPLLLFYSPGFKPLPRRYIDIRSWQRYNIWVQLLSGAFILGQMAFLVNLIGGGLRAIFKR